MVFSSLIGSYGNRFSGFCRSGDHVVLGSAREVFDVRILDDRFVELRELSVQQRYTPAIVHAGVATRRRGRIAGRHRAVKHHVAFRGSLVARVSRLEGPVVAVHSTFQARSTRAGVKLHLGEGALMRLSEVTDRMQHCWCSEPMS
jgi:hypothetical protein